MTFTEVIVRENFFKKTTIAQFAERVGPIIGDINYCHPFREGNGRTQLLYLQQLAKIAGHRLDLRHIDREAWIEASKEAHNAKYDAMAKVIETALNKSEPLGQKNSKTKKPPQI